MKFQARRWRTLVGLLALASSPAPWAAADADDDDAPSGRAAGALPTLSIEQQRAAGIVIAHPVNAEVPQRDDAIGLVLDPVDLAAEAGDAEAGAAGARSAAAEVERVRGLYSAGAGASLKALQAAQAEHAHAHAQADAAAAKFQSHWRPIAAMPTEARQKLIDAVVAGTVLLVRADLPGRHVVGSTPDRALLDADGINVPGQVLGLLSHKAEEGQGAGVLVEVRNAPAGLGPGARVPVALLGAKRSGLLVPRDAVIYDDSGAFVYKQLTVKPGGLSRPSMASGALGLVPGALGPVPGDKQTRYKPVRVKLLQTFGDGWLVDGIDDDDNVVVHGAGVLWSLQGLVGHAAGDIDDD
jgi:hypothetical protein